MWKRNAVVASTVSDWLRKQGPNWRDVRKGVYVDWHKLQDVVDYRRRFIARLEEFWPYIVNFEDDRTSRRKKWSSHLRLAQHMKRQHSRFQNKLLLSNTIPFSESGRR